MYWVKAININALPATHSGMYIVSSLRQYSVRYALIKNAIV